MIDIVVGGQFGSEAKGHVAALLCEQATGAGACVRVGGPNAGHTVIDYLGRPWAFRTLPVGAVCSSLDLIVAAGSEIEVEVLKDEIERVEAAGYSVRSRLYIDEQATILTDFHKDTEVAGALTARLGSTGKGVGAARADRLMRHAGLARDEGDLHDLGIVCDTQSRLRRYGRVDHIIVEGTQGYGLGLHAGYYPFCTSGDCRAVDFLAQAGLHWNRSVVTWVVFRTYPIRVAGNSGPMINETSWGQLGQETGGYIKPEMTTVTKKVRRVGGWDPFLARAAIGANGGAITALTRPVLTFVDYWDPTLAGSTSFDELRESVAWKRIIDVEDELGVRFSLFTTGPATHIWRDQ